MMYNSIVQDCFFFPKHAGTLDKTCLNQVHFHREQLDKSNAVTLYVQYNDKAVIEKVAFQSNGNPYMIAALEWVCRQSLGKAINSLIDWDKQRLIEILEIPNKQYPIAVYIESICKEVFNLIMEL